MFDEKFLKLILDSGVYLASVIIIFRPIVLWMLHTWTKRMDNNETAHDFQRDEHAEQLRLLEGANNKLDVLVKHSR